MSPYLAGGLGVAFLVWSGLIFQAGKTSESHICAEANAQHDLAQTQITVAAQQHVITTIQKQTEINEVTAHAYQSSISSIDDLYASGLQPTPVSTSHGLRSLPASTGGASTAICSETTSKKYKLTPKQCDLEEEKFNLLWNTWNAQAALK
jgi:hypothetical protein